MKIMFVARSVDGVAGGVERMITTIMNALVERGHSVHFFTWDESNPKSFYRLDSKILWEPLSMGSPSVRASMFLRMKRALRIRKMIKFKKPEAIVCFQDGPFIAILAYAIGLGCPIVLAERNSPSRFKFIHAGRKKRILYNLFRFSSQIIIQFEGYKKLYPKFLSSQITTIPNAVQPSSNFASPDIPSGDGRYRLLSVGRLGYQKNYKVLIEAFCSISSSFPDWDLIVIGDGEERSSLEAIISKNEMEDRISMPGTCNSVSEYYLSSHLFCLSSLWEGFPNALAESLSRGLPAVGFEGCDGVNCLIQENLNGLLAKGSSNVNSLANTLSILMKDHAKRRAMGKLAVESIKQYRPDCIFTQWENILEKVVSK